MRFRRVVLCLLAVWVAVAPAAAQDFLEREIGPGASGEPLVFRGFTPQDIGALALAAHVPMGFEPLPPPDRSAQPFRLTGLTLRSALGAMLESDPRYEAFDYDGVIVIRSARATASRAGYPDSVPADDSLRPLEAPAPAVRLGETTARQALAVVAALLGAPSTTAITASDTRKFVLDTPEGTVLSLLNAIVRAHGTLTWVFGRWHDKNPMFPYLLEFMSGVHGWGLGVSGQPPAGGVDLQRFVRSEVPASALDTVVGKKADGYPLVLSVMGPSTLWEIATAANVPFGIEFSEAPPPVRLAGASVEVVATGRTVREVLDVLVVRDSRYEWREIDGVVVVRPVASWSDAGNPLFARVPDMQIDDRPMTEVVKAVVGALGALDQRYSTFPDNRHLSVSVLHGTALDLLNALVRAHGSLVWAYEPGDRDQVRATGLRHCLTLYIAGGSGLGVPVR
jgi:hypothetical protein